jgi:hypothetical protein
MDRDYAAGYAADVFANNRALARAVGNRSPLFEPDCHPSLTHENADAPFCPFKLREPSTERSKTLVERVAREIGRRGLLATNGGSFGFRGHRYELIEPRPNAAERFFASLWVGARGTSAGNSPTPRCLEECSSERTKNRTRVGRCPNRERPGHGAVTLCPMRFPEER